MSELSLSFYPLHESLKGELSQLGSSSTAALELLAETASLVQHAALFLDSLTESPAVDDASKALLQETAEVLQQMEVALAEQTRFALAARSAMACYHNTARDEPPLELDYLEHYQSMVPDATHTSLPLMLEALVAAQPQTQTPSKHSATIHYLANAAFVIQHPLEALPETQTEEEGDDLAVAGGKVDLYDPLTRKLFEDPCYFPQCRHVFDRQSVLALMRQENKRTIDCPTMGCGHKVGVNDLVEDKLMKLRVRAYVQQKQTAGEDIVRL